MPFDRHAFISYSHIDNRPLPTEKDGWVTLFHEALQQLLAGRLGGNAEIWRDNKLRGNDVFSDEIVDQFANTAAFISVLTPRYLNSEWCNKEIDRFCDAAERTGGVVLEQNKCRIFKVLKLPIDRDNGLPEVLSQVLGYEFYELDNDQTPRELDPAYGEKSKQDFLRKLAKLAWDIKLLLDHLNAEGSVESTQKDSSKPIIYLAECSRDRRPAREVISSPTLSDLHWRLPMLPEPYRLNTSMSQSSWSEILRGVVPDHLQVTPLNERNKTILSLIASTSLAGVFYLANDRLTALLFLILGVMFLVSFLRIERDRRV